MEYERDIGYYVYCEDCGKRYFMAEPECPHCAARRELDSLEAETWECPRCGTINRGDACSHCLYGDS